MPILKEIQLLAKKTVPMIETGYTVKIYQKIKEGEKERIQIFEGLVIAINSGHGADKTITVRKVVEGIGVEKIFPLYSTNIQKIEVVKKAKIRRAKLYYMRERSGKSARLKETHVTKAEMESMLIKVEEPSAEPEVAEVVEVAAETTPEVADAPAVEDAPVATEEVAEEAEEKKEE